MQHKLAERHSSFRAISEHAMDRKEAIKCLADPLRSTKLRDTLKILEQHPDLIHIPQLGYLREFIDDIEAKLPELKKIRDEQCKIDLGPEPVRPDETILRDPRDPMYISPEDEAPPPLGPAKCQTLNPQDLAHVDKLKHSSTVAVHANRFEEALSLLTEALAHGHDMATLYTRRAEVLLHMRRPIAASRDCSHALAINPNYARAYRTRGIVHRHLQDWERSHFDLAQAQAIDYDETIEPLCKYVHDKWSQLYSMRHGYELALETREAAISDARTRREIQALERIQKESMEETAQETAAEGEGMQRRISSTHPELAAVFDNPKVRAAAAQMDKHPESYFDLKNDPDIGPILTCLWECSRQTRRCGA